MALSEQAAPVSSPPPQEHPNAPGAGPVAHSKTKPSVASRKKVVSVREAYRQVLKDEQKEHLQTDVNPPASEANETFSTLPTETAAAPSVPAVGAVLPDEPVITDQPRLWLPAAMLEPDESIPITSELQVVEWEQLQEEFVQAVDGRAPANDTEKEAWIRAQQENDDLFRAKFGWDAFRQQQLKAYMEGLAPAPPP